MVHLALNLEYEERAERTPPRRDHRAIAVGPGPVLDRNASAIEEYLLQTDPMILEGACSFNSRIPSRKH